MACPLMVPGWAGAAVWAHGGLAYAPCTRRSHMLLSDSARQPGSATSHGQLVLQSRLLCRASAALPAPRERV